jgi:hypothetical protein
MKIGDLVQIKDPYDHEVGAYYTHLFDEIMLVTEIIDNIFLADDAETGVAINGVVVCASESGLHRFPIEDMETVSEVIDHEIEVMAMALAEA